MVSVVCVLHNDMFHVVTGRVYVVGGLQYDGFNGKAYDSVEVYSTQDGGHVLPYKLAQAVYNYAAVAVV
jgi:hypothetical protein